MPCTRAAQNLGSSSLAAASQADAFIHCPFRRYDGCKDGVGGKGYARNSMIRHLNDKHLLRGDGK
ncbi:hypothetical protein MKW98_001470, partial [Papaver atlanticum]